MSRGTSALLLAVVAIGCDAVGTTFDSAAGAPATGSRAGRSPVAGVVAIGVAPSVQVLVGERGEDPVTRGVRIAVRDLNAEQARGAGGPRFELRLAPPAARTAVEAAAFFRDDASVIGVVGPTDSQSALDAVPVYGDVEHDGERGLVAVSPTATSPVLSGRSAWLFRVCPDDGASSRAAARYALDSLGARRAAVVYRTDVYGKGWARAFAAVFTAGGGAVVLRAPDAARLTEWAEPYASYAKREGADVLVVAGNAADALPMVRAARAVGLASPVLGGDAVADVREPADRDAMRGVRYTALFSARRPPNAVGRAFVAAYAALYGEPPNHRAALAYDAALLIGRAAHGGGVGRQAVRDYLARVGSTAPAVVGATGTIAFDARHDVVDKPVTLARVVE